jgi:hypothetical protein
MEVGRTECHAMSENSCRTLFQKKKNVEDSSFKIILTELNKEFKKIFQPPLPNFPLKTLLNLYVVCTQFNFSISRIVSYI